MFYFMFYPIFRYFLFHILFDVNSILYFILNSILYPVRNSVLCSNSIFYSIFFSLLYPKFVSIFYCSFYTFYILFYILFCTDTMFYYVYILFHILWPDCVLLQWHRPMPRSTHTMLNLTPLESRLVCHKRIRSHSSPVERIPNVQYKRSRAQPSPSP